MVIIAGWLVLAAVVAYIAGERGRSQIGFFALSLVLSPIIAVVVLALTPARQRTVPLAHIEGQPWGADSQAPWGYRCGHCGQNVSPAWRGQCKHCGTAYAAVAPVPQEAYR